MLFNSYTFLFAFLPLSLAIYHGLRRAGQERGAMFALMLLSLVFYAWWNPVYLLLLIPLVLANFALAAYLMPWNGRRPRAAKTVLVLGVIGNLAVLAYFKYANFLVDNLNAWSGTQIALGTIILPLGISFFTFQKIAFLVDAYRNKVKHLNLLDFSLFVSFFPQLIAGPIVHHSDILPQFRQKQALPGKWIMMGLTLLAIGLAKKVLLADTASLYVSAAFAAPGQLDALAAWSGTLAYTAQLYFDFSGYSDMAIGAALLFGIRLPVNFASPYKAASIIEFWRRWHITLSRFLRDYLYVSLGGNRHGRWRRHANLLITMVLGGLWHGANWTFVIWGALHGFYLMINHAWGAFRPRVPVAVSLAEKYIGYSLTFVSVVIGWVFFRASNVESALSILHAMAGANGVVASAASTTGLAVAGTLLLVAWFAPNSQELTGYRGPDCAADTPKLAQPLWHPTLRWAAVTGSLFGLAIISLSRVSEFLYFQF
jgi:alginate O-acetyltransferase complex protein AlgI